MNDTVTTATGKEFPSDYFVTIPRPEMCFFRVFTDIETAITVFGNAEETERLFYNQSLYTGYTHLESATQENDAVKVVMKK